ncbi:hypothetical protein niasHT_040028 [Heterodera trifolii]|uniref:Uncharacterized protein n=1 Tax=Heterodera trifolii TaxID=157864 RepID=A0ABD2J3L6_9BILA
MNEQRDSFGTVGNRNADSKKVGNRNADSKKVGNRNADSKKVGNRNADSKKVGNRNADSKKVGNRNADSKKDESAPHPSAATKCVMRRSLPHLLLPGAAFSPQFLLFTIGDGWPPSAELNLQLLLLNHHHKNMNTDG